MSLKNCATCVFFERNPANTQTGYCEYPVPEWLRIAVIGGSIHNASYQGQDCLTHKSRQDLVNDNR